MDHRDCPVMSSMPSDRQSLLLEPASFELGGQGRQIKVDFNNEHTNDVNVNVEC